MAECPACGVTDEADELIVELRSGFVVAVAALGKKTLDVALVHLR